MEKKIKNDLRPSWSSAIKAMGRFPLITLVFAIISGCSLLQPTKPDPHPSGLTSTASESSPAEPAGAGMPVIPQGPLNLEQAQEIALANNPEIAATQWDLQAADARTEIARAGRWPALGVESGYQRFLDDQRLIAARYNGEPGIFDRDILRGDLVLKLPLYTGGRLPSEIRAAELLSMSEEKRLGRSREELVFNVSGAFYAILSQYEVIRSLEFANHR
ncbi:MAG: TolC family protein [Deltaproteobacteria bacterium]|nr:TolC family protein [Deltaproteobacteria bacterium]